ncbi:ABC transporter permease subunit [Actinomyces sp. 2119]|uniref:ABC transporter permease n=1 Tax=Actinomyces sp. 2119 TaxID=2321393 RepID=UPI000E6C14C9|nr:ABC transporter permease subunit [Actinomyces sp. 2119]RJF40883.1 ABC transporter permease subunit [Actinomyces sp. 2119]
MTTSPQAVVEAVPAPVGTPTARTASTAPGSSGASARPTRQNRLAGTGLAVWVLYAAVVVLVPDAAGARSADTAALLVLVSAWVLVLAVWTAAAVVRPGAAAEALARRLPWIVFFGAWFTLWQLTTVKTGLLDPPYFVAPEVLIEAFLGDWTLLARCLGSSALLFLTGYAVGSVLGFVTGLLMGWSRRADYWLHPLLQTVGPVPAASLLPLAVLILPTTYVSAAFIVAFGAWFPMATMTRAGVRAVPRSYFDVARTLGAGESFLVRRIAIPAALPDMLTGLFTGLGTSLAALMTAELVGVDQGLAWYINWVKGWADYPRMYVGLAVLIIFCRALMILLFKLRSSLLAWQQNLVRW